MKLFKIIREGESMDSAFFTVHPFRGRNINAIDFGFQAFGFYLDIRFAYSKLRKVPSMKVLAWREQLDK